MIRAMFILSTMLAASALVHAARAQQAQNEVSPADQEADMCDVLEKNKDLIRSSFGTVPTSSQILKYPDGDSVVAVHGGTEPLILLMRSARNGHAIWDPRATAIRTKGFMTAPEIAAGSDGSCFVSWVQSGPDGHFVRKVLKNGMEAWTTQMGKEGVLRYALVATPAGGCAVVSATNQSVRGCHMMADGSIAWRQEWPTGSTDLSQPQNPASVVVTPNGQELLVVWYAFAKRGNQFLAQRLRFSDGALLWREPISLGDAPTFGLAAPEKIKLGITGDGLVEAHLYRGQQSDVSKEIERYKVQITPDASGRVHKVVGPEVPEPGQIRPTTSDKLPQGNAGRMLVIRSIKPEKHLQDDEAPQIIAYGLYHDDVERISAKMSSLLQIVPVRDITREVRSEHIAIESRLVCTTAGYSDLGRLNVEDGRFLTDADDEHREHVAVLGADVADRLFPDDDAIGRKIHIGPDEYTVVGVLSRWLPFSGVPADCEPARDVLIPLLGESKDGLKGQASDAQDRPHGMGPQGRPQGTGHPTPRTGLTGWPARRASRDPASRDDKPDGA